MHAPSLTLSSSYSILSKGAPAAEPSKDCAFLSPVPSINNESALLPHHPERLTISCMMVVMSDV